MRVSNMYSRLRPGLIRLLNGLQELWSRFPLGRWLWSLGDTISAFGLIGFGYLATSALLAPLAMDPPTRAALKAALKADPESVIRDVVQDAIVDPKPIPIAVVAVLVFISSVIGNYADRSYRQARQQRRPIPWGYRRTGGFYAAAGTSPQPCRSPIKSSVTRSAGEPDA